MPIFFVKSYCLWHNHLENEIILGGHHARFFIKWVQTLLYSTLIVKYGVNGKTVTCLPLPYPGQAFLELRRAGGGGHKVPPPPSKNPVPLLRIYSSKIFLKACPKLSLVKQTWFPWKPWLWFFRWFIVFRFLTRNHHSKIKNLVPLNKSKKKYLFLKAYEKLNRMTPLVLPWWW